MGGPETPQERLAFASFQLESDGTLFRGEETIHLPPKELQALRLLLACAGQVVTPAQLREALWGEVHVTADSVPRCLSSLRARLEPDDCIQTIYKRGYRLKAAVRSGSQATPATLLRLAILPFLSGTNVPDYLGPAITDETVARLAETRFPGMLILARDSVLNLYWSGLGAVDIGRALNADLVLTGQVNAHAARYRLRIEMIRITDAAPIWVEDLIVEQSRLTGLEAELAQRVQIRLGSPGLSIAGSAEEKWAGTEQSREAYELLRRGRHECRSLHRHRMQDGMQMLMRAIELEPGLIPARVELVNHLALQSLLGFMPPRVAGESIRRTIEQTANLTADGDAMLPALGWVHLHLDHDLPAAMRAMRQSNHLAPEPGVTGMRMMLALSRHRFQEVIETARAALQVDPYSPWLHSRLAWALHLAGQVEASVESVRNAIAQVPGHPSTAFFGTIVLAHAGEPGQALELAAEIVRLHPSLDIAVSVHAYALARAGRSSEARAMMERLQWLSRERFVLPAFNPAAWLALGEPETALHELRQCAELRCPWFFQALADPRLAPLKGNPAFEKMWDDWRRLEGQADAADNRLESPLIS